MWGDAGGQQSARRRAPAEGGWSPSSSSELAGSSPRARCRASPSSSSSRRGRRHHSRQRRRDHGRTESVSFQHLARARATRERAGSAACGWRHVATLVVPPSKGCAAAESGGHACGAALGGAGGRPAVASGGARLAFRSLGSALPSVCSSCSASAGETTTVVHLCATRGSRCLARVATGTHWALRIHLTHDCQPGSAATGARRGSGQVRLPKGGRNGTATAAAATVGSAGAHAPKSCQNQAGPF